MSADPELHDEPDTGAKNRPARSEDDLDRVRQLLLSPEQAQLARLQHRLDDPGVRAAELSAVLPEAVRRGTARNAALSVALTPAVEEALQASVRRDPRTLVDAIAPVMGPAIRRAIAEALRGMVESLNHALESSLSWRGVMWRVEALRTGKPFAEVVLLHTLVYQVEQVFLIHRHTSLLLQHVVPASMLRPPDADLVSGMLSAIQDFVQHSFEASGDGVLQSMHVGDLTVLVEPGPLAMVVAVVRGQVPPELRGVLQGVSERIHRQYGVDLTRFEGDAAPFEACRPELAECLRAQYKGRDAQPRRSSWRLGLAVALAALLGLAALGYAIWSARRWSHFVDRLRIEPGLMLVEAASAGGRYRLVGMRDPLAADPATIAREAGIDPAAIDARWEPYASADSRFVTARARTVLAPPPTVQVATRKGVLELSGTAPRSWIATALPRAALMPAVTSVDAGRLAVAEAVAATSLARELDARAVFFKPASAELEPTEQAALAALAPRLRELSELAQQAGGALRIDVIGYTDETGTDTLNQRLGLQRAGRVVDALVALGIDRAVLRGLAGAVQPAAPGDESQRARQRRADVRLRLDVPGDGRGGVR
jgi:outer membrane protein OmpA-like peptidoglycan-associated protein